MTGFDWLIVAIYLLIVLCIGAYARREASDLEEYFLAGRRLGIWLVVLSVIATETSAATVIGGPDTAYRGNLAYLQTTIGAVLSRFFLAYFVIDHYFQRRVTTVYAYLALRFGNSVRSVSAGLYCLARLFASGARLYIASYAVSIIAGIELEPAILLVGLVALAYGVVGGLRAVVLTDVVQAIIFFAAGCYSLWFVVDAVGGLSELWLKVNHSGKLQLFDLNFNLLSAEFWRNPYTLIGAVVGGFTLGVATHGTDQDNVQRLLASRNSAESRRSIVLVGLLEIPVALLFVSLGIALWAFYQQAGVVAPPSDQSVFPFFILHSVPAGVRGLLLAGIMAAAMSSLDSTLNSLSSVSIYDFYLPRLAKRNSGQLADTKRLMRCSKWVSLFWGLMLIASAYLLGLYHQSILTAASSGSDLGRKDELLTLALGVMSYLYGPLLGVFVTGIFTTRGSEKSVLLGVAAGLLVATLLQTGILFELGWTWHIVLPAAITVGIGCLGKGGAEQGG